MMSHRFKNIGVRGNDLRERLIEQPVRTSTKLKKKLVRGKYL